MKPWLEWLIVTVGPWWFAVGFLVVFYAFLFAFGRFMDWVDAVVYGAER